MQLSESILLRADAVSDSNYGCSLEMAGSVK